MSHYRSVQKCLIAACALIHFSGCGGGGATEAGSSGGAGLPAKFVSWTPPAFFTDRTPLDPSRDLDIFEIYVKEQGSFTGSDLPVASVRAIDPTTGQVVTSFNLANLGVYITPRIQYRISLKAVTITGEKSDFSAPATFSF